MEREEQFKLELQATKCQKMGAVNFELEMAVKVSRDEIVELQRQRTGLRDSLVAMKCHAEELHAIQLQGFWSETFVSTFLQQNSPSFTIYSFFYFFPKFFNANFVLRSGINKRELRLEEYLTNKKWIKNE